MAGRKATLDRKTKETQIHVEIDLDGSGVSTVDTGIGFFDHMLTHLAKHSLCDLTATCKGDLQVDAHHTVEDVGIAIGTAILKALGDKAGITRYGSSVVPMDESCVMTALDISGRGCLVYSVDIAKEMVGSFDTELAPEFFRALVNKAGINAHIRRLAGGNAHHTIEAAFKSFARALRAAVSVDPRIEGVPSTKGTLE
ncbi:MAG: imidazoleglycerol-phosphate dehydratase [Armatimonadetes bacterium RBG_16_58_9]|nr:MAG: imidazoleglycerol-phosphate dehydratase [Armatimonadetes bacterium RBG_16_58_9]